MKSKVLTRVIFMTILIAGFIGTNHAQDISKASEAFNNALALQTSDPMAAITSVKSCLEICDQIGEDADDLKMMAGLKLPELYFNVGNGYASAKKYTAAIPAYLEAIKVAQQYETPEVERKAKKMLPQLHYMIGGGHYKKKEYEEAASAMQQAIEIDPDYAKAYYYIGLVRKKQKDLPAFEAIMDKGLVAAKNSRDNNYKKRINKSAASTFLSAGAKLTTGGKPADAIPFLEKSLKYDQKNSELFFYIATAQNELKQWDKAIEAANRGLLVEKDEADKKAKHYFNLGTSFKGKGDKNAACEAYKNALYGQFKENAQYEIEHTLKCNK
ncbi:MAG: tetratricopeptide repeat protein [Bacteroidota bacterium]|nr:tetratricopeptide repeat protein [Bacteroidota bacterium]